MRKIRWLFPILKASVAWGELARHKPPSNMSTATAQIMRWSSGYKLILRRRLSLVIWHWLKRCIYRKKIIRISAPLWRRSYAGYGHLKGGCWYSTTLMISRVSIHFFRKHFGVIFCSPHEPSHSDQLPNGIAPNLKERRRERC